MTTLVVMAAGVGRRFGGDKQLVAVGPDGESFLDYAVTGAVRAGATQVVLVVRSQIEALLRSHIEARHGTLIAEGVEFAYVRQDEHGPERARPWGTGHAVLTAAAEVSGPFVVCNADDYYGAATMAAIVAAASQLADGEDAVCVHRLDRTLSPTGAVSSGVCETSGARLRGIIEHHGVAPQPDGSITATDPVAVLAPDTPVSMNLWAFRDDAFDWLAQGFEQFLAVHAADADSAASAEAEYLLPSVVAQRMREHRLSVRVVTTDEAWIGVTNPDDLATARSALAALDT